MSVAAYLGRGGGPADFRAFARALAETLEGQADTATRDGLFRAVGARLAGRAPLPPCGTLAELESRMNAVLADMGWGYVALGLDMADRTLVLRHEAAPAVATEQDAQGGWITPVLEGLHGTWLAQQPGSDPSLALARTAADAGVLAWRYGRPWR